MDQVKLSCSVRPGRGSAAARRLRRTGLVPAVVYGQAADPVAVAVDGRELHAALHTEAGANALIDLHLDGKNQLTVVREVQRHPVRGGITHLDFVRISLTEKIEAEVLLEPVGTPTGVREDGGVLETVNNSVMIEALPTDIPASISIDIGGLHIGESLSIADLPQLEGITYLAELETTLYTVQAPRVEEEVLPEVELDEEGMPIEAVEGEEAEGAAEGEEAAEGDDTAAEGDAGGDEES
ncbi:MAG: 50S ribosomal protein L25 [Acidimicrobiia bacterium]|nr:50S ribosomal protein L25 [Acidimicrobiia bacterium]MDH3471517.1 50S ribosomal protein L25 [Acidimicrobiia bacterium]